MESKIYELYSGEDKYLCVLFIIAIPKKKTFPYHSSLHPSPPGPLVPIPGSFTHPSPRVCSLCSDHDPRVNKEKDYEYPIKTAMFLLNRPAAV